jgi:hypothetical protein
VGPSLTGLIPQALIGLRATLHAADATTRPKAAEQLAWCYSAAAATLTHLRQPDAGFMAARRALDFVRVVRTRCSPGLPLASRCRHLADRACAHANLGQQEQALALLLTAEGMSPDWIRHQTLARAVIRDLLTAERRRSTPLRQLAKRIGVNR